MAGLRNSRGTAPVVAALVAAALLAACSESTTRPQVATVTVTIAQSQIVVGSSTTAAAVVRDSGGNVLGDRAVTWSTSDAAVATIDPTGLLSTVSPGSVSIVASADGITGSVPLVVTAGPAALVVKDLGDGQVAAPAAAVAVAPRVRVTDALGFPVPGAAVAFAVASGGGSVTTAEAQTSADGFASCDAWTLGTTIGSQALTASAGPGLAVTFTAAALRSSADLSVSLVYPVADQLIGDSSSTVARVQSTYEIASVVATGGAAPTALAGGLYYVTRECRLGCWGWLADVSNVGLPSGPRDVVVTVTDVLGHVADALVRVRLDRPPAVTITSPAPGAVARPTVTVSATCADDAPGGCTALNVRVPGQPDPVLSGTSAVSGEVDLSSHNGYEVDLSFTATDAAGQVRTAVRPVFVESSGRLAVVASVPGTIWDYSAGRALFVDQGGVAPALRIRDTSTGATEDVASAVDFHAESYGYLTATGALYAQVDPTIVSSCALREWRSGQGVSLGGLNSCSSLRTAGTYAVYSTRSNPPALVRRDLAAGTSATISDRAMNLEADVAASGRVVFASVDDHNVYGWADGVTTALTTDGPASYNYYVRTDGVNALYLKDSTLVLHDGTGEVALASFGPQLPSRDYAIADGWIAYVRGAAAGSPHQVWRRHGSASEQLTFFGGSSTIDAIGPDGTIVLSNALRRYLAAPGAPLVDVTSRLGRVVYRDGKFLVILGGTVLEIVP